MLKNKKCRVAIAEKYFLARDNIPSRKFHRDQRDGLLKNPKTCKSFSRRLFFHDTTKSI